MTITNNQFTVDASLNADGVKKGAQQASKHIKKFERDTQKVNKNIVLTGTNAAQAFDTFKRSAISALSVFTGGRGMADFVKGSTIANTQIGNLSNKLSIMPQKLMKIQAALAGNGGDPNAANGFFQSIHGMSATGSGRTKLANQLTNLYDVSVFKKDRVTLRDDILSQLSRSSRFRELNDAGYRATIESELGDVGIGDDVINLLGHKNARGQYDYDKYQQSMSGIGYSPEQIQQGRKLMEDWTRLRYRTETLANQSFANIAPSIDWWVSGLDKIEKSNPKAIASAVQEIGEAITALSAGGTVGLLSKALFGLNLPMKTLSLEILAIIKAFEGAKQVFHDADSNPSHTVVNGVDQTTRGWGLRTDLFSGRGWSANSDLDKLVGAVAMEESGGDPFARSSKGAIGPMQIMPKIAQKMGLKDPNDPIASRDKAKEILSALIKKEGGDLDKSLADYNWGYGNVHQYGINWREHLSPKRRVYIADIKNNMATGHLVDWTKAGQAYHAHKHLNQDNSVHTHVNTVNFNPGSNNNPGLRHNVSQAVNSDGRTQNAAMSMRR